MSAKADPWKGVSGKAVDKSLRKFIEVELEALEAGDVTPEDDEKIMRGYNMGYSQALSGILGHLGDLKATKGSKTV